MLLALTTVQPEIFRNIPQYDEFIILAKTVIYTFDYGGVVGMRIGKCAWYVSIFKSFVHWLHFFLTFCWIFVRLLIYRVKKIGIKRSWCFATAHIYCTKYLIEYLNKSKIWKIEILNENSVHWNALFLEIHYILKFSNKVLTMLHKHPYTCIWMIWIHGNRISNWIITYPNGLLNSIDILLEIYFKLTNYLNSYETWRITGYNKFTGS